MRKRARENNSGRSHLFQCVAQCDFQTPRPLRDTGIVRDKVLAYFDQHMGQTVHGPMPVHTIVLQPSGIGLIVADRDIALTFEAPYQRPRQAPVAIPQHADMPGRASPRQTGVKLWMETRTGTMPCARAAAIRLSIAA